MLITPMTAQQMEMHTRFVYYGEYDLMYSLIASHGHRYAQLAFGVLNSEDSIAGTAATGFLESTVKSNGRRFNEDDRVEVYRDMAAAYVDKLNLQVGRHGMVLREINFS